MQICHCQLLGNMMLISSTADAGYIGRGQICVPVPLVVKLTHLRQQLVPVSQKSAYCRNIKSSSQQHQRG